jgi:protein SCO1/2
MTASSTRRRLLGATLLTAALTFTLSGCERTDAPPKASFHALDITGADYARQLTLTDPEGKPRALSDFKGKVVVVFFGYTQCPDVCPTTLSNLLEVKHLLGPDGDKLQAVFVSVDPQRDTAELLKNYIAAFDPSWIGLRGTPEEIAAAAKEFKVFYRTVPGRTPDSYTVDHTAASYVFDTQGRVRLYVRHAAAPADVAADIRQLLQSPA